MPPNDRTREYDQIENLYKSIYLSCDMVMEHYENQKPKNQSLTKRIVNYFMRD